jgi:ketosteroid isomerase-like protein
MVPEDIALVRRFHERVTSGDVDGALDTFHPQARFDWSESISPFRDVYVGHAGLRRFLRETDETWENFSPRIEEVIECGEDQLLTPTTVSGRARASGIEMEAHGAVLWTVRDGLIVEGKLFQNKADALDAAGRGA